MDIRGTSALARNAFIYALATTIMVISTAWILSALAGSAERALAARVDANTQAIVCILKLGVSPDSPPRNENTVAACLLEAGVDPYGGE